MFWNEEESSERDSLSTVLLCPSAQLDSVRVGGSAELVCSEGHVSVTDACSEVNGVEISR